MAIFNKILMIMEPEHQHEQQPGLDKAVKLAEMMGAKLELFVCCYNHSLTASYLFDEEGREHAINGFIHGQERYLEDLANPLVERGIDVSTDVCWRRSTEVGILKKVMRYHPDLVVKGCRTHHRFDIHLFGDLDWQLIRDCPVPLMLTKSKPWGAALKLVAAVDPLHSHERPSMLDKVILDISLKLSKLLQSQFSLFHSYQALPVSVIFDDTLVVDYEAFRNKMKTEHLHAMEQLRQEFGIDPESTEIAVQQGEVYQALPDFVDDQAADLVVMGAVARSGMERFFIGSTTEKVLGQLSSDILVVKDPTFQCRVDDR
jgi:universal stress protein E